MGILQRTVLGLKPPCNRATTYPRRSTPPPREARPALVGFLTAGFPSAPRVSGRTSPRSPRHATWSRSACRSPTRWPTARPIQRASFVALADGVTLPWILEETGRPAAAAHGADAAHELLESAARVRPRAAAARGARGRRRRIHRAGLAVRGERRSRRRALDREGLALVQMVTPVTPAARLAMLCRAAQGLFMRSR